ncbi:hypothetical protein J6A34_03805 [bacterium]|nr:hypothetical protein [bacterium]
MQLNKVTSDKVNIQPQLKAEITNNQPETLFCENSIETSIYNQKGVQVPFCGLWSKSSTKIENECIELLQNIRNGKYKLFTPSESKKILQSLEQELCEEERPQILKEVMAITWDEAIPGHGVKVDMFNAAGEPISRQFIQKLIKLNAGRSADDRLAVVEFARYEQDIGATEPLGAFFKLPEERLQELIPFLRRITDLNYAGDIFNDSPYEKYIPELYDHFRCLVYGIDDLSKPGTKLKKQQIKDELVEVLSDDYFWRKDDYPSEETRKTILELVKDMNDYAMERIVK